MFLRIMGLRLDAPESTFSCLTHALYLSKWRLPYCAVPAWILLALDKNSQELFLCILSNYLSFLDTLPSSLLQGILTFMHQATLDAKLLSRLPRGVHFSLKWQQWTIAGKRNVSNSCIIQHSNPYSIPASVLENTWLMSPCNKVLSLLCQVKPFLSELLPFALLKVLKLINQHWFKWHSTRFMALVTLK